MSYLMVIVLMSLAVSEPESECLENLCCSLALPRKDEKCCRIQVFPSDVSNSGPFNILYTQKTTCPPTLPVDMCDARCGLEVVCENKQVCCPTECGGAMCVDPVTERHFVTQEKPGKCPEEPRGPWICSHMCTSDSDCRRALKCCGNRCGARACQLPEFDEPPEQE